MSDDSLGSLARDLGEIPANTSPKVRQAIQQTSLKIKQNWQDAVAGAAHLTGLRNAVSYETEESTNGVTAEIGFDKGKDQGALGNVSEFGTPRVAGRAYGAAALAANEDDFNRGLDIAIADGLREAGL